MYQSQPIIDYNNYNSINKCQLISNYNFCFSHQVSQCGTDAPMWLDTGGRSYPPPGESARHVACAAWSLGSQRSTQDCCLYSFPITVTNCVDFFVYNLLPARGCNMAYCATGRLNIKAVAGLTASAMATPGSPRHRALKYRKSLATTLATQS